MTEDRGDPREVTTGGRYCTNCCFWDRRMFPWGWCPELDMPTLARSKCNTKFKPKSETGKEGS